MAAAHPRPRAHAAPRLADLSSRQDLSRGCDCRDTGTLGTGSVGSDAAEACEGSRQNPDVGHGVAFVPSLQGTRVEAADWLAPGWGSRALGTGPLRRPGCRRGLRGQHPW